MLKSQIENSQAAGLKVSAYHFSHFPNTAESQAGAKYFLLYPKSLNLPVNTTLVNDFEGTEVLASSTGTDDLKTFAETLNASGYQEVVHYSVYSYFRYG